MYNKYTIIILKKNFFDIYYVNNFNKTFGFIETDSLRLNAISICFFVYQ